MKSSVRKRITATIICFTGVPLLLAAAFSIWQSLKIQGRHALLLQKELVWHISSEVHSALRKFEINLNTAAGMLETIETDGDKQRNALREELAVRQGFSSLVLYDSRGVILVSAGEQSPPPGDTVDMLNTVSEHRIYVGPIRYDSDGSTPRLLMAIPMSNRQGTDKATLAAVIDLDGLWTNVEKIRADVGSVIFILDNHAAIVARWGPPGDYGSSYPRLPERDGLHRGHGGKRVFLAALVLQLGKNAYTIVAERDRTEAIRAASVSPVTAGILPVVVLFIVAGLGFAVVRSVVSPIKSLEVAASFTTMRGRLRETLDELQRQIDDRAKTEAMLRKSEDKFQAIADYTYDWENWFGPDGALIWVNSGVGRFTGYSVDEYRELPGMWFSLIHEEDRSRIRALINDAVENRTSGNDIPFRLIRKDNAVVWGAISYQPIYSKQGEYSGVRSSVRDITDRKEDELRLASYQRQLRKMASELALTEARERREISADLHDGIGQSLAMIKLKIKALRQTAQSDEYAAALEEIEGLVEQVSSETRSLTLELSPPILYELGFVSAVDWLSEKTMAKHDIRVDFKDDGIEKNLGENVSIVLYKAVREAIINVVKHANASRLTVDICAHNGEIQINIEDDGIGFDRREIESAGSAATFGLFNMAERMDYIGGSTDIKTKPGTGTRVFLSAPLESETTIGLPPRPRS